MGHLVGRLTPMVLVFLIGWFAGERYGAPGMVKGFTDKGFSAVENAIGGSAGGLWSTLSEAIPGRGQSEDEEEKDADKDSEAASGEQASLKAAASKPRISKIAAGVADNNNLKINAEALALIKKSEGLRLEVYAAGGRTYIGYGHQIQPGESSAPISEAEAEALLRKDLDHFENGVRGLLTRPANPNQFSAMVSLAYTKGVRGFERTDVLKKFNAGDIDGAADEFLREVGASGPSSHLMARREKERALFLKPV